MSVYAEPEPKRPGRWRVFIDGALARTGLRKHQALAMTFDGTAPPSEHRNPGAKKERTEKR